MTARVGRLFFSLALVCVCFAGFLWWATRISPGSVMIAPEDSITRVAEKMRDAGIIRSSFFVRGYIKIFMPSAKIFPGVIVIPRACGWVCAVNVMMNADANHARITFPEGDDLRDIKRRFAAIDVVAANTLFSITGRPAYTARSGSVSRDVTLSQTFLFLKAVPPDISFEGYLFPDTYVYDAGQGARGLVTMMLRAFDAKIMKPFRADIVASGHSLHEIVTVASLLEKEVKSFEDRAMVADIIWRRFAVGMPLQLDASVQYVVNGSGRFTTSAERAIDSPWNTYKYRSLPVGPISNPGVDSVRAALHPVANGYWYYLTGPDGAVHYARTLDEHALNKKFLK